MLLEKIENGLGAQKLSEPKWTVKIRLHRK